MNNIKIILPFGLIILIDDLFLRVKEISRIRDHLFLNGRREVRSLIDRGRAGLLCQRAVLYSRGIDVELKIGIDCIGIGRLQALMVFFYSLPYLK